LFLAKCFVTMNAFYENIGDIIEQTIAARENIVLTTLLKFQHNVLQELLLLKQLINKQSACNAPSDADTNFIENEPVHSDVQISPVDSISNDVVETVSKESPVLKHIKEEIISCYEIANEIKTTPSVLTLKQADQKCSRIVKVSEEEKQPIDCTTQMLPIQYIPKATQDADKMIPDYGFDCLKFSNESCKIKSIVSKDEIQVNQLLPPNEDEKYPYKFVFDDKMQSNLSEEYLQIADEESTDGAFTIEGQIVPTENMVEEDVSSDFKKYASIELFPPTKYEFADNSDAGIDENKFHLNRNGENPRKCHICGKAFSHKSAVRCHLLTHTGELKGDKGDSNKKRHKQTHENKCHLNPNHNGEKTHKCCMCEKAFSHKSTARRHLLTHTGVKRHKCSICNKTFSHKCTARRHLLTHTGVKRHKCSICNKAFSRKDNKVVHEKTHNAKQKLTIYEI